MNEQLLIVSPELMIMSWFMMILTLNTNKLCYGCNK
jgi:hypothetical protein